MLGRLRSLDQKVLDNISRIHSPGLNMVMKTASRSANVGLIWWLVCLPFLINPEWRSIGFNYVIALSFAHVMGEGLIKHMVKRIRPCHGLDDDEQIINRPRFYSFPSGHTTASFAMVGVSIYRGLPPYVVLPIFGYCNAYQLFENLSAGSLPDRRYRRNVPRTYLQRDFGAVLPRYRFSLNI